MTTPHERKILCALHNIGALTMAGIARHLGITGVGVAILDRDLVMLVGKGFAEFCQGELFKITDRGAHHLAAWSAEDKRQGGGGLSTPEPPPTQNDSPPIWDLVIKDMQERDTEGRRKYGTPLQAGNGRDATVDAYQEALDLVVYLRQSIEERATAPTGLKDDVILSLQGQLDVARATNQRLNRRVQAKHPTPRAAADTIDGVINTVDRGWPITEDQTQALTTEINELRKTISRLEVGIAGEKGLEAIRFEVALCERRACVAICHHRKRWT